MGPVSLISSTSRVRFPIPLFSRGRELIAVSEIPDPLTRPDSNQ